MKYKVAISGSYGGMNLGDEAILECILKELRSSIDADITVFSRNPKDTEARHKVRAIPIREMHKDEIIEELKKLDLLILGGGGILFDNYVEIFLREVIWAKELGIPVMVYAISVGPLKLPESKKLVADTLNQVEKITVREAEAKRILHDLGVNQEIEVTADPALLLNPQEFTDEMMQKEGLDKEVPLVGFSIREPGPAAPDLKEEQYHTILANAADFMAERFKAQIMFVPMELEKDMQQSHAVVSKMANVQSARILKESYSADQILGLVSRMEFAVGMRLHFLIFAAITKVPFVPLPYAPKVSGFLEDLEMIRPSITETNIGKLIAYIDRSWDVRKNIKSKLEEKVPVLIDKGRRTNQILVEMLSSLTPREGG